MSKGKTTVRVKDSNNRTNDEQDIEMTAEAESTDFAINGELEKLQSDVDHLKELLQRKAAEFENYKRRTESEASRIRREASEKLIIQILPVFDDLRRSVESVNNGETKDFETLRQGVQLIFNKFSQALENEGLSEINTVGQPFNVDLSDAIAMVPGENVEPNTVIDSVERGYKLGDKVIRHEKVRVSS